MSRKYKISDQEKAYFVTFTVINWVDIFIRNEYKNLCIESIQYCQANKGLNVYAWCIMTSHIHMIVSSKGLMPLEGIIRDTKSYVSRCIHEMLEDTNAVGESRREWMLDMMRNEGMKNSNNKGFQFWQQHNHPIILDNNEMIDQKIDYIHNNPVVSGFVEKPEDWIYSSAIDYITGRQGKIKLELI